MSDSILCFDLYGKTIAIPKEKVSFRPSVYGIILHKGKILLCNTRSTGKYSLPGGGIDIGETIHQALHREVYEECGIEITVNRLADVGERFFYYNPLDFAGQNLAFLYFCTPKTFALSTPDLEELEAEQPQWIDPSNLKVQDFQIFGDIVLRALNR
jgi:8-oxo-dGTP pyrophosphatase MutT (NUDIX family)